MLANHSINYFNNQTVNIHDDYRPIRSILQLIAILRVDQSFDQYRWTGQVYRGMILTEIELKNYQIGVEIMNKSVVSTSKSAMVAKNFSGFIDNEWTSNDPNPVLTGISVICTYVIKNRRTALNIENISDNGWGEREVVILPYSIFKITSVTHIFNQHVEIFLEEVLEDESNV